MKTWFSLLILFSTKNQAPFVKKKNASYDIYFPIYLEKYLPINKKEKYLNKSGKI